MTRRSPPPPMLDVVNITRRYLAGDGSVIEPLRNVSFGIEAGGRLSVVGSTGSGKSTLFRLIAGLIRAQTGDIVINRRQLATIPDAQLADWRLRHLGIITSGKNLVYALSVRENVELPLWLAGVRSSERRSRAHEALEATGLLDLHRVQSFRLSPFHHQVTALARALVTMPDLILMDEPTGGLATAEMRDFINLCVDLCDKLDRSVLMLTDNLEAGQRMATPANTVWLHDGSLHLTTPNVPRHDSTRVMPRTLAKPDVRSLRRTADAAAGLAEDGDDG
ncbi:MAG: ABC transporter ATP-binding protein [Planctomycetota bacterium]